MRHRRMEFKWNVKFIYISHAIQSKIVNKIDSMVQVWLIRCDFMSFSRISVYKKVKINKNWNFYLKKWNRNNHPKVPCNRHFNTPLPPLFKSIVLCCDSVMQVYRLALPSARNTATARWLVAKPRRRISMESVHCHRVALLAQCHGHIFVAFLQQPSLDPSLFCIRRVEIEKRKIEIRYQNYCIRGEEAVARW